MSEINPGNEALTQLRPFWDKIACLIMLKSGIKEVTLDFDDIAELTKTGQISMAVLGRKKMGEDKGFTLVVCKTNSELAEVLAKHQGRG